MVGLSIVLEAQKKSVLINRSPQVINKANFIKPSSSSSSSSYSSSPLPAITFLDECFLCKQRLLPGKDIFMYRGDRAFCSVDCRCRQICMDEESVKRDNSSLIAAIRPSSFSSSSPSPHHQRKPNKNSRPGRGFVY